MKHHVPGDEVSSDNWKYDTTEGRSDKMLRQQPEPKQSQKDQNDLVKNFARDMPRQKFADRHEQN
jgi:hypothetical protein